MRIPLRIPYSKSITDGPTDGQTLLLSRFDATNNSVHDKLSVNKRFRLFYPYVCKLQMVGARIFDADGKAEMFFSCVKATI